MNLLALKLAERAGVFAFARALTRRDLRILCYHGLWTTPGMPYGDRLFMPPEQFEHRLTRLKRSGHPVLALADAVRGLADGSLPERAVAITIDDGWSSTYTHMLPVLERLELPATLYVTTWYVDHPLPIVNKAVDYIRLRAGLPAEATERLSAEIDALPVGEREAALRETAKRLDVPTEPWWSGRQFHLMTPGELRDAKRRGLDIQLHTHRHRALDRHIDGLERDLADNRRRLADMLDEPAERLTHFCYPSGGYHPRADAVLRSAGVLSATLVDEGINRPGSNPFRLRRFLDGRSVSDAQFDAYLSGALELYERARQRVRGIA